MSAYSNSCKALVARFDNTTATTSDQIVFADCVKHLNPPPSHGVSFGLLMVSLAVLFASFLIARQLSSMEWGMPRPLAGVFGAAIATSVWIMFISILYIIARL